MIDRDAVLDQYVETMCWTMTDGDGDSFDGYPGMRLRDLPEQYHEEIRGLVDSFLDCVAEEFGEEFDYAGKDAAQIGHDLYLTMAHHGAGFWDGDYPDRFIRMWIGTDADGVMWSQWSPAQPGQSDQVPPDCEVRELGDILTKWAQVSYAPHVEIQDADGKWWSA